MSTADSTQFFQSPPPATLEPPTYPYPYPTPTPPPGLCPSTPLIYSSYAYYNDCSSPGPSGASNSFKLCFIKGNISTCFGCHNHYPKGHPTISASSIRSGVNLLHKEWIHLRQNLLMHITIVFQHVCG